MYIFECNVIRAMTKIRWCFGEMQIVQDKALVLLVETWAGRDHEGLCVIENLGLLLLTISTYRFHMNYSWASFRYKMIRKYKIKLKSTSIY